jgi:hypothetical protein
MRRGIWSVNGKPERVGVVPLWIGANYWSRAGGPRRLTDGSITLDPFGVSLMRCETRTLQASTPERGDARA